MARDQLAHSQSDVFGAAAQGGGLGLDWFENAGHSLAGGGGSRIAPYGGYAYKTKGALGIRNWHDYSIGGAIACRPTSVATGDGGYAWILRNVLRPGGVNVAAAAGAPYNPQSQLVNVHFGLNDMGILGAAKPLPFQNALRTILGRFCAASVFEGGAGVNSAGTENASAQWAYTGTWADLGLSEATASSSGIGIHYSTTVNDKATFTVPADFPGNRVVGIGLWFNATYTNITYGIKIDGVSYPDLNINVPAISDQTITNMHPHYLLRIGTGLPGDPYGAALSAGTHSIEITLKAGAALAIDYAHIESDPLDGPILIMPLPNKPANYTIWSGWPGGASMNDAAVDQWKDYQRQVQAEFPGRVIEVDLDSANLVRTTDGTGDFIADGAHPNERGHGKWVELITNTVRNSPLITDRVRSRPFVDSRPRAWKKVGQINGAGAFNTGWSNLSTAGLYDLQWRTDDTRRVFVRGSIKAAAGATTTVLAANTLPKSSNLYGHLHNRYDGTTWTVGSTRNANTGVLSMLTTPSTAAGNMSEFFYDYQAE